MGTCAICKAEIKEHPAFGLCDKCAQPGWDLLNDLKKKRIRDNFDLNY